MESTTKDQLELPETQKNREGVYKKVYWVGIGLLAISLTLLLINIQFGERWSRSDLEGLFVVNYCIAVIYSITIVVANYSEQKLRFWNVRIEHYNVGLALYTISCFALNEEIRIFANMIWWAGVYLFIMFIPLVIEPFYKSLPNWVKLVFHFIMGLGTVMSLYFTLYLGPAMFIGVVAFFILGLSLHLLTPLAMVITYMVQFARKKKGAPKAFLWSYLAGLFVPILLTIMYVVQWSNTQKLIHETHATMVTRPTNELPDWMILSQRLPNDVITRDIIRGNLYYQQVLGWDMFGGMGNSFGENKTHNPLISTSDALMGTIDLSTQDRIKILKSRYDARHQAHRKLWSGKHLQTAEVLSDVEVFSDYGIAYMEKIITIKNANERGWPREEEALYSFNMPEGSIVTSLSLWVNGVEQKARLTTRQKADSAYSNIVKVQRRDPALLHWQEGNRITVTVFPCTKKEDRKFKVGFTVPLIKEEGRYTLQNVYFDGPERKNTRETTVVTFANEQLPIDLDLPSGFNEMEKGRYQKTGDYKNYWEMSFDAAQRANGSFSFGGNTYELVDLKTKSIPLDPEEIYLDINSAWTKQQVGDLLQVFKGKKVYAYYDKMFEIENTNSYQVNKLLEQKFSLFPFYQVKDRSKALVISASTPISPNIDDLKGTTLLSSLKSDLRANGKIKLFHIGMEPSPYIKSLKEFEAFDYTFGTMQTLQRALKEKSLPIAVQDESIVPYEVGGFSIKRTGQNKSALDSTDFVKESTKGAPDHLMRLFAYKQVMASIGLDYFDLSSVDARCSDLNGWANEAFIVTPISTLIVLETQQDYDRFGIDKNKNSLKNASNGSSGAVPEPEEWLLIILVAGIMLYFFRKRLMQLWALRVRH